MKSSELAKWFENLTTLLESAYLQTSEPWKQSGFAGPQERWERLRQPISECIDESGSLLDIGCANGYLLECLQKWTRINHLDLYGLDISSKLVDLAKTRLPLLQNRIFTGNAWDWQPPLKFNYVRTELVYVPDELRKEYLQRLMANYLSEYGKVLVCQYRSTNGPHLPWINEKLREWGYDIINQKSGFDKGLELTRVLVVAKK
jgi:SAM-dependent methyltransferase